MEYVGRRVKKEFQGRGACLGSVQAYEAATGLFKIVYDGGDSEELEFKEVSLILAPDEPPPSQPTRSSAGKLGCKLNKRRRIAVEGIDGNSSANDGVISGSLVDRDGDSGEFDLNLTDRLDLNDDAVNCLRHDNHEDNVVGGGTKLHGLDLNEGVDLELDVGLHLNAEIAGEDSPEKNKMIDLNLDVNEEFEKLSEDREGRCFDLNLQLMEDEVRILEDSDGRLEAGGNADAGECMQMKDDAREIVDPIASIDKKEDSQLEIAAVVDNENVAPITVAVKRRGRKRKNATINNIEFPTPEVPTLDIDSGNTNLELERRDETPSKIVGDLVNHDHGIPEVVLTGRRGRKKKDLSNNDVILTTPETGLRRSTRRAKRAAFSDEDLVVNGAELFGISHQLSSPAISDMPHEKVMLVAREKVRSAARRKSSNQVDLPPKVKLPPPSSDMDLIGVSLFDFVSVYTFLRSFSTLLFLSPFELEDFVASIKCRDSSLLFDSIHVSLLKTLRKHLESLAAEGSVSASDCLRSLNWDFLDLITWPMFLVEYLLLHSPGHIPGLDRCQLKFFQNDYYKLPISVKVEILRHLCDDVIETEALRSEVNRRTLATDRQMDLDHNMRFESCRKRKSTVDAASTSCITGDDAEEPDWNSDECCLCKMDGNLICCDGCPAAFHSRCVGVVGSMLPEGEWYCPECVIERDKPCMKVSKSTRGAELLGIDPYGRLYYSSCGYLLVLDSCNDVYSYCTYNRNDLPSLIEFLESSPVIFDTLIDAICKNLNVVRGGCGTKRDLDTRSSSIQSAFPEKGQMRDMHLVPSEAVIREETCSEKRSDEKSMVTTYSSNEEHLNADNATPLLETGNGEQKMENHLASSEGSAEVSQTFMKTNDIKESAPECAKRCSDTSDYHHMPEKLVNAGDHDMASTSVTFGIGKNLRSKNCSHKPLAVNSKVEVHCGTDYINCYEFGHTASLYYEEFTRKSSDKASDDSSRSIEEIIAGQLKIVSNRHVEFSWSNIRNSNMNSWKERCGWCLYCRVPEYEKDCLFSLYDSIPAIEKFSCEVLGIQSRKNVKNHLIDVMCHIICIEDHLQGLLLGPWLNPDYSVLWRTKIREATNIATLKTLLLQLESNLHHLAISADWRKHVDSMATVGSAAHIVSSSARASSKHGISRKRANSSEVSVPSSNAATGLSLFWWRGGRGSRALFKHKVLPHSLASKAARQGGRKKIPGIFYPECGEYAKRTKYDSWRAAVETSRSVEQLALQVRELDANIRWDDIGNNHLLSMVEDSKKPVRTFKKVIVRRKCLEGSVIRYLLDFGKRRFIPDVVIKHGSKVEDSSSEKKRYWLEESHVPLHLLKAFEEKRIARKSNIMKPRKLCDSSRVIKRPLKEKGFSYLFSRAERLDNYQCGHCKKDVLIREAVSCRHCKGFFHKRHVRRSAGYATAQCTYSCHKCHYEKFVKADARKGRSESLKLTNASKSVKLLSSRKGRKKGKGKRPANSKSKKGVSFVVPLRRSARNAERIAKIHVQNNKSKKRKRGRKPKSEKYKSKNPKNNSWKKHRTPVMSSYWLNGLRLSRKPDDERHFRNRMLLVLSGEVNCILNKPKCSLCQEVEHNSGLNYAGCEICGDWFHGDALDLGADKIANLIGFKCHRCLNKMPPVCPHNTLRESSKLENLSEDNVKTECTEEGSYCVANPEDLAAFQKSNLDDKPNDSVSTVNMEKQLQGFRSESNLKDKNSEKILLGNDPIKIGGKQGDGLNTVETESTILNFDMVKEAECLPIIHGLVENGVADNEHSDVCSK